MKLLKLDQIRAEVHGRIEALGPKACYRLSDNVFGKARRNLPE